jgi:hypothetical protein
MDFISSREEPTHVMCGTALAPIARIALTASKVPCAVLPPAPYVTEKKLGSKRASSACTFAKLSKPWAVRGGKNSKLKSGVLFVMIFLQFRNEVIKVGWLFAAQIKLQASFSVWPNPT